MNKPYILACSLAMPFLSLPAYSQTTQNEKIAFQAEASFNGNKLASQLYGVNIPGMESSLIDLDSDGVAELVVRFKGNASNCNEGCDTSVLAYGNGRWKEIIRRKSSLAALSKKNPQEHFRDVILTLPYGMGDEIWKWSGNGYKPSMEALGTTIELPTVARGNAYNVISEDMKDDIAKARGTRQGTPTIHAAEVDVNGDGKKDIIGQIRHQYLCSNSLGCPTAVYISEDKAAWSKVLDARSLERVVVSKMEGKDKYRDILISGEDGYSRLAWNGKWYDVYDTSYLSSAQRR